jgi:hypothetical protein
MVVLSFPFLLATLSAIQTSAPERKVEGNMITSQRDPEVRITLPSDVQYVGADRWILYDIADCELHVFVEAGPEKTLQKLYWVQFEGYVPSRPELHHTYDSPKHATIGGMDFYVDTWVRTKDEPSKTGSDVEHIVALLDGKGYRMPAAMMYVRLVHLLDAAKRKELMIIYGEDLAPTGFTAPELNEGGKAHDRWPSMADALQKRAEERLKIEPAKR